MFTLNFRSSRKIIKEEKIFFFRFGQSGFRPVEIYALTLKKSLPISSLLYGPTLEINSSYMDKLGKEFWKISSKNFSRQKSDKK